MRDPRSGEFIDPQKEPALESEANSQYNIKPVPFQTENKYSASVTNSYFNVLVKYGSEFQTLGFRDLIEVKQAGETGIAVNLRDPEFEITRAIKKVLDSYRGGGDLLSSIAGPVQLEAMPGGGLPELPPARRAEIIGYTASSGASSPQPPIRKRAAARWPTLKLTACIREVMLI
jgi:ABC-2 type transport system permease protein